MVQEAGILDPEKIPGYFDETELYSEIARLEQYMAPTDKIVWEDFGNLDLHWANITVYDRYLGQTDLATIIHQTISQEEFGSILDGNRLGRIVYNYAFNHLRPLRILAAENVRDFYTESKISNHPLNFEELTMMVTRNSTLHPFFDARISPPVEIGADKVRIFISYFGSNEQDELGEEECIDQRLIKLGSKRSLTDGADLKPLIELFPEMIIKERLYAFRLPQEVLGMQKQLERLSKKLISTGVEEEEFYHIDEYVGLYFDATTAHLRATENMLKSSGITIVSASWYDDPTNMVHSIPIRNMTHALMLMDSKDYKTLDLPVITGNYRGHAVKLRFEGFTELFDFKKYAMEMSADYEILRDLQYDISLIG